MELKYNWKTIKEFKEILFQFYHGIARISINRPEVHNAFTPLTVKEMISAMDHCRDDLKIKVVVFTGAGGKHFAAEEIKAKEVMVDMWEKMKCQD